MDRGSGRRTWACAALLALGACTAGATASRPPADATTPVAADDKGPAEYLDEDCTEADLTPPTDPLRVAPLARSADPSLPNTPLPTNDTATMTSTTGQPVPIPGTRDSRCAARRARHFADPTPPALQQPPTAEVR